MQNNLPAHGLSPSAIQPAGTGRCRNCGSREWSSTGDCTLCEDARCCDICGHLGNNGLVCHDCREILTLVRVAELIDETDICDQSVAQEWRLYAMAGCSLEQAQAAMRADRRAN